MLRKYQILCAFSALSAPLSGEPTYEKRFCDNLLSQEKGRTSLFVALVNGRLKAVLVSGQVIRESLLERISLWLRDQEQTIYQKALAQTGLLALLPEDETVIAAAAGGDGGDPEREPDDDPTPLLSVAGDGVVLPWIPSLYEQNVLAKHRLLATLRQRVQQAIASGHRDLARILGNRIMVIEADLWSFSQVQSPANAALQALLLMGLTGHHQKPVCQPGGDTEKKGTDDPGTGTNTEQVPADPSSKKKPCPSVPGKAVGLSGDGSPGPKQPKHTEDKTPCPLCKNQPCQYALISLPTEMSDLPLDILQYIFRYTNLTTRLKLEKVCKSFRVILNWGDVLFCQTMNQYQEEIAEAEARVQISRNEATGLQKRLNQFFEKKAPCTIDFSVFPQVALHFVARFYQLAPNVRTYKLRRHTKSINCFEILAGDRLLSGSVDRTIRSWDLTRPDRQCDSLLPMKHDSWFQCIEVLPDNFLYAGFRDKTVKVWDLTKPRVAPCTYKLTEHTGYTLCFKFLKGDRVLSGSVDKSIKVWTLSPAGALCIRTLNGHEWIVWCMEYLEGNRVVSGSCDGTIRVWDLNQSIGEECQHVLNGNAGVVYCLKSLRGNLLVAGFAENMIKVWNLNTSEKPEIIRTLESYHEGTLCIDTLPDHRIISGSCDQSISVWDLDKPAKQECTHCWKAHERSVICLKSLPDGRLFSGYFNGVINVWDYYPDDDRVQ